MASRMVMGYENQVFNSSAALAAITPADSVYTISNLLKKVLAPPYRTADRAIVLDGSADYMWIADHADFKTTGNLTMEVLFKANSITGTQMLFHKLETTVGHSLALEGDELRWSINGSGNFEQTDAVNIVIGNWYRVKMEYWAGGAAASFWVNQILVDSTTSGTIPGSITSGTLNVGVGATAAGAGKFDGTIAYIAIVSDIFSSNGILYDYTDKNPTAANSRVFWKFQDDFDDSTDNGHTLTPVSLGSGDFVNCTAYQCISFYLSSASNYTLIVIDGSHNISSNGEVKIWSRADTSFQGTLTLRDTISVTAGQPIVYYNSTGFSDDALLFEINDPGNSDGNLEISFLYAGYSDPFASASFQINNIQGRRRHSQRYITRTGGIRTYSLSKPFRTLSGIISPLNAADRSILESAADVGSVGDPIIVVYDSDSDSLQTNTYLVHWLDANNLMFSLIRMKDDTNAESYETSVQFEELTLAP